MSPVAKEGWDLTPAIDLIYSLSIKHEENVPKAFFEPSSDAVSQISASNGRTTHLGNFDKIWQFLGQPLDTPPPELALDPAARTVGLPQDQGSQIDTPLKAVKWRDEVEGADLADDDDPLAYLTKSQRKKARRKLRRRALAAAPINGAAIPSDSEGDSDKEIATPKTPDRKSIINKILFGKSSPNDNDGRLRLGNILRPEIKDELKSWPIIAAKQAISVLKPAEETNLVIIEQRRTTLLSMLRSTFIDERPYLSNLSLTPYTSCLTPQVVEGIHVFIDASNVCGNFISWLNSD